MRPARPPGPLEAIGQSSVGELAQLFLAEGLAGTVAAEAQQAFAVAGRDVDVGVQREALEKGAAVGLALSELVCGCIERLCWQRHLQRAGAGVVHRLVEAVVVTSRPCCSLQAVMKRVTRRASLRVSASTSFWVGAICSRKTSSFSGPLSMNTPSINSPCRWGLRFSADPKSCTKVTAPG